MKIVKILYLIYFFKSGILKLLKLLINQMPNTRYEGSYTGYLFTAMKFNQILFNDQALKLYNLF